jgi:hypothetical protein
MTTKMNYRRTVFFAQTFTRLLLLALTAVSSCKEEDDKAENESWDAADLYFDYRISGEEGKNDVTLLVQYKKGGQSGKAISLADRARVDLDGQVLKADSAKLSGVFYEARRPLVDFAGVHRITFSITGGKQFSDEFLFTPFTLKNEIPERVSRNGLDIVLDGVDEGTPIRYVLSDTSFESNGINEVEKLVNNTLHIDGEQLEGLKSGPVSLLLMMEMDKRLNSPGGVGRLRILYELKREFLLE